MDELLLEPQMTVIDDHDSNSDEQNETGAAINNDQVPQVDNMSISSSSIPVGRRHGRMSRRLAKEKIHYKNTMVLPSFMWDYFIKDASGKFVICTLCPAQTTRFAYSGGTSTMNRHLRKKHQKYAPGKCPTDYEDSRRAHCHQLESITSSTDHAIATASSASLLMSSDTVNVVDKLVPNELLTGKQQHQLLELRTARRRVTNGGTAHKRKKVVTSQTSLTTDFDPCGFMTGSSTMVTSGALQFPAGFELNDADSMAGAALDQRREAALAITGVSTVGSGYRHHANIVCTSNSFSNRNTSANCATNQKILTHRLLKYFIAQYEPLEVSHMGAELRMLLFVGSTEWLTPIFNFGYGVGGGMDSVIPRLPSEESMKLALANLYNSQREILKDVIADVEVLSLSLNNWTSAFGQSVLTVSGHWISRGFRRRDCVLEVYILPLDERVNIIALLRDVMEKWDIPSSKVAALTVRPHTLTVDTTRKDEMNAMSRTMTEAQAEAKVEAETNALHSEYPGLAVVRCFVSELDRAISSGLLKCVDLTCRCRNYASYFIQNPSEYQIFLALQRSMSEEASACSAASTQTALMAATADRVSVSIVENSGNTAIGGKVNSVKEDQCLDTVAVDASSSSQKTNTTLQTSASCSTTGDVLPVICDYDGRWNSTTEMMCRIVQLESVLLQYKVRLESDTNPARRPMQLRFLCCELSREEWTALKQLAQLLDRVESLVHVSPFAYPGLSIVHPLLHSLKKHLADADTWVSHPLVATVRDTIDSNLNTALCSSGQASSSPYLSCLLDPRFKTLPFLPTSEKDRLVESLYILLQVHDKDETISNNQHQHDTVVVEEDEGGDQQKKQGRSAITWSGSVGGVNHVNKKTGATLLHEFFPLDEPVNEMEKLKAQVQQYLDSPSLPATDDTEHDPLEWWSRYERLFPSLARLARKYLCITGATIPFQEAYTNYGQLMREKRARLDIQVAAQVLFCRSVSRIPEIERIGV